MQLLTAIDIASLPAPLHYTNPVLLIGSCFTEHIEQRLMKAGFTVLANPFGILFSPLSIAHALSACCNQQQYTKSDLFYLNETWNSWDHHSRYSHIYAQQALAQINEAIDAAHSFLLKKDLRVIITLGTAFQYYLNEDGRAVANNHRAPAHYFRKELLSLGTLYQHLQQAIDKLLSLNPSAQIIFTISPVRHLREGVVQNNHSKARLIHTVHELVADNDACHYFPAYELVIDVLRDYRFYDIDLAHPNYAATQFVWEHFLQACIDPKLKMAIAEAEQLHIAASHRPRFPDTEAHKTFLAQQHLRWQALQQQHPAINLSALELVFLNAENT